MTTIPAYCPKCLHWMIAHIPEVSNCGCACHANHANRGGAE